jgi:hypothetical protein
MPSEAHSQVAAEIRQLAGEGRYHGRASELVKMFGVPLTPDGVRVVDEALATMGLATKPQLNADKPKQDVIVVVVAALPDTPIATGSEPEATAAPGWYPDPAAPATRRYWDGGAWTDEWSEPARDDPPTLGQTVSNTDMPTAVAWLGLAIIIVGSIGPWATAPLASISGTDGDGKITIGAAVLGALLLLIRARAGVLLLALVALAVGIYDAIHIHKVVARTTFFGAQVDHVGWGVYAVIAGAVIAFAGAWQAMARSRH